MKNKFIIAGLVVALTVSALAIGSLIGKKSAESAANKSEVAPVTAIIDVNNPPAVIDKTEPVLQEEAPVAPQKNLPENKGAEQETAKKSAASVVTAMKTATENKTLPTEAQPEAVIEQTQETPALKTESAVEESSSPVEAIATSAKSMPFEAEVGLGEFNAYRMNLQATFDGTRNNGQKSAGAVDGIFEVTKNPGAQHWQINLNGDVFNELAMLGGGLDLYKLGGSLYMKNPADGSFIGIPAAFVDSMLPQEMYNPENSIELPATATLQPGQEIINGVAAQKYTFTAEDLGGDTGNYDNVDGAIWVAIDGNYVVKYTADFSGKFDNLSAGGINVLEEGTISMAYDISDVNGDFNIQKPAGANSLNLGTLLLGALN